MARPSMVLRSAPVNARGEAAFAEELVLARDIETNPDPEWTAFRILARSFNVRAWVFNPLVSPNGKLLGAFTTH
jgi:hypothetical protein